jgi:hypothetical protein
MPSCLRIVLAARGYLKIRYQPLTLLATRAVPLPRETGRGTRTVQFSPLPACVGVRTSFAIGVGGEGLQMECKWAPAEGAPVP